MYVGWCWRQAQEYAPEGWSWVVVSGTPELQDEDGYTVGCLKYCGSGVQVVLEEGLKYSLVEWVAEVEGCSEYEAQGRCHEAWQMAEGMLRNEACREVVEDAWGVTRARPGRSRVLGPLHEGVTVVYGPGSETAIRQVAMEADKRGYVVAWVQELSDNGVRACRGLADVNENQPVVVVVSRIGPGNYYTWSYWREMMARWVGPWVAAGHLVVLRGWERTRGRHMGGAVEVSSADLRGDPLFYAHSTLVFCPDRRRVDRASEALACETVADSVVSDGVPVESRISYQREEVAMVVQKRGTAGGGKKRVPKVAVPEAVVVPEMAVDAVEVSECSRDSVEDPQPVEDATAVHLFQVEEPTGCDSPQGNITPVPDTPEFREEPEHDFEVIVRYRTTDELLTRVWIILARKEVVAYDSKTLWVQTEAGQWVDAEKDIKHLRWRLYNDIRWTDFDGGRRCGRRVAHRALLELADLMVLHPETRLEPRPQARDGRVVKITEMAPLVGRVVALDTETSGPGDDGPLDPRKNFIELLQINDGVRTQLMTTRGCTPEEITEGFRKLFDHADVVVGHNLSFDLPTIWSKTGLLPKAVFDTMVAAVILKIATQKTYGGAVNKGLGLAQVAEKYLGVKISKEQQRSDWAGEWTVEQLEYAARDVQYLHALMEKQVVELNKLDSGASPNAIGLRNRVARLEMAMVLVMVEPTVRGIPVNLVEVERQIQEAHKAEMAAEEAFHKQYPLVQNINSAPQIKQAFAEDGVVLPDLTAETVNQYLWHPGVRLYSEYKTAVQVYRNLRRYREEVVYPSWYVIGAGSGRMSSSGPGVQNVPKVIKPKFYNPSLTIVKADYPAIESRLAAVYAGEQGLIEAFNAGEDIHVLTASRVLGKEKTEVQKSERQLAKALNYGLLYGVGPAKFAASANSDYGLHITVEEASEFREKFFEAYPALRDWHHKTAQALRSGKGMKGRTLFGRVMAQGEEDYTDALNYPIQGSGADLLKLAAVKVWQDLKAFEGKARLLNLVHDEIVVAVMDPSIKAQVAVVVRDAMEEAARKLMPQVKTPVDVEIVDADQGLFA